jgi:hypothetical protein
MVAMFLGGYHLHRAYELVLDPNHVIRTIRNILVRVGLLRGRIKDAIRF